MHIIGGVVLLLHFREHVTEWTEKKVVEGILGTLGPCL